MKRVMMFMVVVICFISGVVAFETVDKDSVPVNEGGSSSDEEKWKEDRTQASKWNEYDEKFIHELSGVELKSNSEEAEKLYNNGKLSAEQKKGYAKQLAENPDMEFVGDILEGSVIGEENGKKVLFTKDGTRVNLWDKNINGVGKTPDGKTLQRTVEGNFIFDGKEIPGNQRPHLNPNPNAGNPVRKPGPGEPEARQQSGGDKAQGLQQILGLISQLFGAIPKGGEATTNGNNEMELADGAEAYLPESDAYVQQNCVKGYGENGECLDEPAVIKAEGDSSLLASNTKLGVMGQADIYVPENPGTYVELNGVDGNGQGVSMTSSELREEYSSSVLGAVISPIDSAQYVRLIQHDLMLGGERILVEIFKSFSSLEGDGEELWVRNGEMNIKFDGVKIYYSRKIGSVENSVGEISNADKDRIFSLIEYRDDRARLIDNMERVSIGDVGIEHPREDRLIIAKVREDWWVERE
ncbi:hypothetical protein HOE04_00925 [archaeon]|jgi:hypothetical protein|nr:hypothetical protein [archaeon]